MSPWIHWEIFVFNDKKRQKSANWCVISIPSTLFFLLTFTLIFKHWANLSLFYLCNSIATWGFHFLCQFTLLWFIGKQKTLDMWIYFNCNSHFGTNLPQVLKRFISKSTAFYSNFTSNFHVRLGFILWIAPQYFTCLLLRFCSQIYS